MNTTTNLLPALAAFTLFTGSLFGQILVTPINPISISPTPRPIAPVRTPQQIALNRWYEAASVASVSVPGARAIAFDGEYLWAIGVSPSSMTRIRPSDASATEISFTNTGSFGSPVSIVFDSAHLWLATTGGSLFRYRISTGQSSMIALPASPAAGAMTFDGEFVYVALSNRTAARYNAKSLALAGTITLPGPTNALFFDGQHLWAAAASVDLVSKIRPSDGATLNSYTTHNPTALTFDGVHMWITNGMSHTVTRLRVSDGVVTGTFPTGMVPFAIAYDGNAMWIANWGGFVTKIRASDGAALGTYAAGWWPCAVAFDGASVWVANQSTGNIMKM